MIPELADFEAPFSILFLLGAAFAFPPSVWLAHVFAYNWRDPIFRALTIYFVGAALINAIIVVTFVSAAIYGARPAVFVFPFRIAHALVLWYLLYAVKRWRQPPDDL
jgi:hypothetical protein